MNTLDKPSKLPVSEVRQEIVGPVTFAILFGIIGGVMVRQRTLAVRDVKRLDPAETLQDGCF